MRFISFRHVVTTFNISGRVSQFTKITTKGNKKKGQHSGGSSKPFKIQAGVLEIVSSTT
jgi:hypothetical protein